MGFLNTPVHPATLAVVNAALGGKVGTGELVTYAGDYGTLDRTGATDMSAVLRAGLDATPDGGTFLIPPGNYRLNTTIGATGKTVHVSARGVKFIYYGAGVALQFTGGWDATYAVSSATPGSVTIDSLAVPTIELAIIGSPTYKAGDVIKLVADDAIPGTRPASGGQVARVGQFLVVHSVSGSTIRCIAGGLVDPFTTNIRVAKLNPNTCTIDGLTATVQPSALPTSTVGLIQISQLINPVLKDVKVEQSGGQAISAVSCYGYTIEAASIGYANNDPAGGIYGYAVADNASSYGRIRGLNARVVRHAYTTNTNQIAAGSALFGYGRTYGAVVSDSVAHSTSGASWDTHNDAIGVRFVNCASYDAGAPAFSLRGRKNSVVDCLAVRPAVGLYVFSEDGMDGDSWGHTIENLTIDTPTSSAITFYLKKLSNVIDTRPTNIGSVKVLNAPANSLQFTNATVRIGKLDVVTSNFTANNDRLMTINRSNVAVDNARLDFAAITSAATNLLAALMVNTAALKIADLQVINGSQTLADKFAYFVDTSNGTPGNTSNTLQVDKSIFDYAKAAASPIPWADSNGDTYLNYRVLRSVGGGSSNYVYFANTTTASPPHALSRTTDPSVILAGTITAALDLPALRGGRFAGQSVTICNLNGSGTLTVKNGPMWNIQTKSGADVALTPSSSMRVIWDGATWREA